MVLIKCRRHYGKKFTVYSKGKSRTVYDGSRYEYKAKDHGLSSKSIIDVNLLTGSERTNLTAGPSFHTEDPNPTPNVESLYMHKKIKRNEEWSSIIGKLILTDFASNVPETYTCRKCSEPMEEVFRCRDCGPNGYFCSSCLDAEHMYPHLHTFEKFMNGTFISCCRQTPVWRRTDEHLCSNTLSRSIVVIDGQGRQHVRQIQFCSCETSAETLVRMKLWPSSPKSPQICFHFDLLEWMTALLTGCHLSVKNFCNALHIRFSKHDSHFTSMQVKNLYKILMSDTASWYRHFQYKTRYPTDLINGLDNGTSCPCCYKMSEKIYSFDADFQLVRKASSGKSIDDPKHHGKLFEDQKEVDEFMNSYDDSQGSDRVDCNDFQAGNQIRSKVKSAKLDEKAVFGVACRHEVPVCFFNLRHGERLGYAVYTVMKLLERNKDQKIHVMYDIACLLDSHLKKRDHGDILRRTSLSVPVFHNYGHKMVCQVLYNPRRTAGIGLTDGECMERLWSFLGRFAAITKEMTPENKTDLLTDGLLKYAFKIKSKQGEVLVGKLQKAAKLEEATRNMLQETIDKLDGVTEQVIEAWSTNEKVEMQSKLEKSKVVAGGSWEEVYAEKLHKSFVLRSSLQSGNTDAKACEEKKLKSLESQLTKEERAHGFERWNEESERFREFLQKSQRKQLCSHLDQLQATISERNFMLNLMKKYARGQSVAIRITRQLKRITRSIKKSIDSYNSLKFVKDPLPAQLEFSSIITQEFWSTAADNIPEFSSSTTSNEVPLELKKECISMLHLIKRCSEEKQLVCAEMESCLSFYSNQHSLIILAFEAASDPSSKAIIIKEGLYVECTFSKLLQSFFNYINIAGSLTYFHELVGLLGENENTTFVSGEEIENLLSSENVIIEPSLECEDFSDFSSDEDCSDEE